ncbi:MAG: porin [Burkholderiales bacterium]|nr:porin [Burkholderiales bacterium]
MKKTALAAALAALSIGSVQAQSTTTIYGLADAFVGQAKTSTPTTSGSQNVVESGGMSTSYWGFAGSEDLGGGLKAVFAVEGFLRLDVGNSGRFNGDGMMTRNAFIGLEGGFGRVQLGRNTTPYFVSTIVYNPFGDSFSFSPAVMHSFRGYLKNDSGWNNSIGYSNSFGPIRANALYSVNATGGEPAPHIDRSKAFGGSLNYGAGPLGLNVAYQETDTPGATLNTQKAMLLSGAYDLKVAKLFGQYQEIKDKTGALDKKDKSYQIGASVPVGPGSVLASYGNVKTTDNNALTADQKRNSFGIGYDYFLSKRTDVYAAWFETKLSAAGSTIQKDSVVGLGVRHRF